MKNMITITTILAIIVPVTLFAAPTGLKNAQVLPTHCDQDSSVVIDSKHNIHLACIFSENYESNIRYVKFKNDSTIIAPPVLLTNSNMVERSKILIDGNDNLYIVGMDRLISTLNPLKIFFIKLDANGTILIPKTYLPSSVSGFDAAIDSLGRLHVVWTDTITAIKSWYQRVEGTSFSGIIPVIDNGWFPSIAIDSHDAVHFVWPEYSTAKILHRRLDDNGNLSPVTQLATSTISMSLRDGFSFPRVAIDSLDHLRVIWADVASPIPHVVTKYQEFSNVPHTPLGPELTFSLDWWEHRIVTDKGNNTHILWRADSIYYAKVSSAGQVSVPMTMLSGYYHDPQIIMDQSGVTPYVTWRINDPKIDNVVLKKGEVKPVLLVHGTGSNDSIWDPFASYLKSEGFTPFPVGKLNGQPGLVPNKGDINQLKLQVKSAIAEIKNQLTAKKVDVIAHSMGGLATRAYIRSNGYEDDIQNLITLGTPHLGTPLANYLAWSAVFPFIENFATAQQIPNSLFLRGLNYKYDTKNVKHFSFAGTKLSEKTWVKLFVCLMEPNFCAKGGNQVISDTIVPKSSSNFSGGSCIQTSDTHSNTFGPAYYNSETMALIKDVLLHPEQSPSCPMPLALPPANTVEAIVATSTIAPSQEQIAVANYDGGKGFQAFLESNSAQLSMNLVTPTGSILNASSCASFPGVICTKDSSTTTTVESISVPESLATGNWQAKVSATSLVMPTTYNQHIFISRPVRVRAMTDSASYAPNAPIQLLATVTDESLALIPGVSVATKVTDPAGFLSVVPLFDDGTHGDSVPADGTFSNLYSATGAEGLYLYETTASGIARGSTFTITSKGSAFVETVPDLMVISPKLTLHVPSGSTIATISASFKNIGDRAASNVTIDFYAKDLVKGDKVLIGQTHVGSIAPNQTVNATFNWNISVGRAEVSAAPSDTNLFEDRDYSNEQATAELDSCRWIKGLTPPNKNTICAGSEIAAHEPGVKEMKPVP